MTAISINRQRIFIFIFWQRVKGSTWCTSSRWPGCWRQRCSSHSNCFVYLPWRSEPPPAGFVSCLKTSCAADVVIEAGRKLRTNPQWRGSKDVSLSQDLSLGTNNPGQEQFQPRGVWGKRCVCVWGGWCLTIPVLVCGQNRVLVSICCPCGEFYQKHWINIVRE